MLIWWFVSFTQTAELTWKFQMLQANSSEEGINAQVKWTQCQLSTNSINDHLQYWIVYTALVLRQRQAYLQYTTDMSLLCQSGPVFPMQIKQPLTLMDD